jgi:NAD(P)H-nitrite reductase large subunit
LRPDPYYAEQGIHLKLNANVAAIDVGAQQVMLAGGARVTYDRLLLATGAEPVRPPIPGAQAPHVYVLRSLADCQNILAAAAAAKRVVVLGASFIGPRGGSLLARPWPRGARGGAGGAAHAAPAWAAARGLGAIPA